MLRFIATSILALGLFSFANAEEISNSCLYEIPALEEMSSQSADIDPVVRRAVLKICADAWEITFVTLEEAFSKGELTIEVVVYGTNDLAYDVTFASNFLCVLDSSL